MIEINLLEKKKPLELPIVLGIDLNQVNKKSLILGYVIYYLITSFAIPLIKEQNNEAKEQVASLRKQYNSVNRQIKKFGPLKEVMEAFNRRIEELKSREDLVAQVMSKKSNPYKVLTGLSGSLKDDIWFNHLTIDKDQVIKIEGESISFASVGEFVNNVKELEYFISRGNYSGETFGMKELKEVQEELYGETVTLQSFSIEGKIQSYGDLN